ncbi:MAG TPA: DegT/DnrJ/EryC1/StrS family aminotransferase [Rhodopila sp.]|nr:DegT/DnrJ/EryC1/StrS family aminotransferase [Rhodopila sp.]
MITVTKPFLPPLADYQKYVQAIWDRGWLTNHGPLVAELEERLREYLGVEHLLYVTSGTLALQLAFQALDLRGEVITTPFSYVATTSSLLWEKLTPVMVDIDPETLNIDPDLVEPAITARTTAILAVHTFGNACAVERLQAIAQRHGLRLIFDAAHAFGAGYKGRPLCAYGDVTAASFHATKLFHTVEGGAVITADPAIAQRVASMRNFGHNGPNAFDLPGINGKNSELHAAMGLCNLPHVPAILAQRRRLAARYSENLRYAAVRRPAITPGCDHNHAYYPIIFRSEAALVEATAALNAHQVFPRRYLYPSLSTLPFVPRRAGTPVCDDIAPRVLCLPLYHTLSLQEVDMISDLVSRAIQRDAA